MTSVTFTPWPNSEAPASGELDAIFKESGLRRSWWSNGPGDHYAAHSHPYHKVLYCAAGSIRFDVPGSGDSFKLGPGDRLDIPPGVTHSADVGPQGVSCVEAARHPSGR